jgi:hypothetical protein
MLKISYVAEDVSVIQRERYHHPQSVIRQRMTILALHNSGIRVSARIFPIKQGSEVKPLTILCFQWIINLHVTCIKF